jgi:hypothetical protein
MLVQKAIEAVDRLADRLRKGHFSPGAIAAARKTFLKKMSSGLDQMGVTEKRNIIRAAANRFDTHFPTFH